MLLCLRIRTWTPGQKCTSVNAHSRNRGQCRADTEYGNPPPNPRHHPGQPGSPEQPPLAGPTRLQAPWSRIRPPRGKHALAATATHGQSRGGRGSRGWPCPDPVWCRAGTGVRGRAAHTSSPLPRLERSCVKPVCVAAQAWSPEVCGRASPSLLSGLIPHLSDSQRWGVVSQEWSRVGGHSLKLAGDTREPWPLAPG